MYNLTKDDEVDQYDQYELCQTAYNQLECNEIPLLRVLLFFLPKYKQNNF